MSAVHAAEGTSVTAVPAESIDYLRWRDELLQVMYWMAGEGLGKQPTVEQIQAFLAADAAAVATTLEHMLADGYVTQETDGGYRLTDFGLHEGMRSFTDEFHELTHQAHGDCGPNCTFCHSPEGDPSQCPSKRVSHAAAG